MRRRRVVLIVLVVLALAVGACDSTADDGGSSTSTSTPASTPSGGDLAAALVGRTFVSQSVTVAGVDHPLVGTRPITVRFGDGELSAQPGCNQIGAAFSWDGDRLVWSSGSQTEMACSDPGLMEQDTWFGGLIAAGPTVDLAGDRLTMTSGDTVIVFVDRRTADPDRPLVGTSWTLESIIDGAGASSVPAGATATMRLPDTGTITWTACNPSSGHVGSLDETAFTVGDVVSTRMACSEAEAQVDGAMHEVLNGTVTFEIEGPVLRLRNGSRGLDFRSA
ncbi:MAG: META domain-containing protein [Acidimicrobiales bacterium]